MKKLRALMFLMMAMVVGGVYATFTYYEVVESTSNISIGIDAVVDPYVYNIIDISAGAGEHCAFYTYDDDNNNVIFDWLGSIDVSGIWNVEGEQLESFVGKEIAAAYVKITSVEGVNNFNFTGKNAAGEDVSYEDIDTIQYSTEEFFISNVAFDETGSLFMKEENRLYYYDRFELSGMFNTNMIWLNDAIQNLETSAMWEAFANCFDAAMVNIEITFRPI